MIQIPNLLKWHKTALGHLRADRYHAAIAPLCRLLLALEPGHEAEPVVRATLTLARRQLAHSPRAATAEL
jgi:hypothetical protein